MSHFLQHKPLCLASSSPRRQMLLKNYGLQFECRSPKIDETPRKNEAAKNFVKRMATEKARAVQRGFSELPENVIILAGDTIVFFDNMISWPFYVWMSDKEFNYMINSTISVLQELRSK